MTHSSINQRGKVTVAANTRPATHINNYGGQVHIHNNQGQAISFQQYSHCTYPAPFADGCTWRLESPQASMRATHAEMARKAHIQTDAIIKLLAQIYAIPIDSARYTAALDALEHISIPVSDDFDLVREELAKHKDAAHSAKATELLMQISKISTKVADYADSMKSLQAITIPTSEQFDGVQAAMADIKFAIRTAKQIKNAIADGATKQVQVIIAKAIELTTQLRSISTSSAARYTKLADLAASIPEDMAFNPVRSAVKAEIETAKSKEWAVAKVYETSASTIGMAAVTFSMEVSLQQVLKSMEERLRDHTALKSVFWEMVTAPPVHSGKHHELDSGRHSMLSDEQLHSIEEFASAINPGLNLDQHAVSTTDLMPVLNLQIAAEPYGAETSALPGSVDDLQIAAVQYGNVTQAAGQCPLLQPQP